ncbi:DUF397 domain-containing protein [Streptomyces sp. 5.8]|uniref:DUF397 domain-containing protein n=1 Tax=unclassified Streptomyces TaxID=2593676 RepID=UPI001FB3E136|nr:DUF397 domain-containing protein [Streptomyces sp. APSN-46.1]MCJ1681506.1 DUF397 domain-containing protein [Streptomyces sp. APSN-46.1]
MDIQWRKSSKSTDAEGNCLEVAVVGSEVLIRESDDPGLIIKTSRAKLRAFIDGAAAGEFDDLA